MAYSELPWRPFLGHQAYSFITFANVFFILSRFLTFLFLFERCLHLWCTLCSKKGDSKLMAVTLLMHNWFSNCQVSSKFAANCLLKIPPHIICVATLPCESRMSENERQSQTNAVINDELQGTVVTYLRCGEIVNNQIKKGLLLCLTVMKILKVNF